MSIRMIFVPVDFSGHSDQAVDLALEIAQGLGATVHLFHCFQVIIGGRAPVGSAGLDPKLREEAEANLHRYAARLEAAGITYEKELIPGAYPSEAILHALEKVRPDLTLRS